MIEAISLRSLFLVSDTQKIIIYCSQKSFTEKNNIFDSTSNTPTLAVYYRIPEINLSTISRLSFRF